jgi:hypothetical protein
MRDAAKSVPKWARGIVFVIALMNGAFGVMGYLKTELLFPDLGVVAGITGSYAPLVHASREFSARNLAIGIAMLLVSIVGVPESIAIVTIIRALIELQTIIITAIEGKIGVPVLLPAVLLVAEVLVVRTMFGLVAARDREVTEL